MASVTSASRYITSASRYHPRYQSRSSMYILGLIPRNFAEMAEAVQIGTLLCLLLSTAEAKSQRTSYNQAANNLAFHFNEISKDKLSII